MSKLEKAWYSKAGWLIVLWPLAFVFQLIVRLRRRLQQKQERPANLNVPVIVIGNISVGGTGKTPLLIALVKHLQTQGFSPGVVTRGYGADTHAKKSASYPLNVTESTPVAVCGDEAQLIHTQTGCPVVVNPDRPVAVACLLAEHDDVDVVLSDDGLQHYRLWRDLEIAVVDGQRLFGNGMCLPAGPLRESVSRLGEVDFIVINEGEPDALAQLSNCPVEKIASMHLKPKSLVNMVNGKKLPFSGAPFNMGARVQAVTALGNPERFFETLSALPYEVEHFTFADHHLYNADDFGSAGIDSHQPVVMTEKDAVKCQDFAKTNFWVLSTALKVDKELLERVSARAQAIGKEIEQQTSQSTGQSSVTARAAGKTNAAINQDRQ